MASPIKYPDFAVNTDGTDNDIVDTESGENNVIEPGSTQKLTGWLFRQKPPRNNFNWLHRITTQWIRWLHLKAWNDESDNILFLNASLSTGGWFDLPAGWTWDNTVVLAAFVQKNSNVETVGCFLPVPFHDGTNYAYLTIYRHFGGANPLRIAVNKVGALFPTSPQWRIVIAKIVPKNIVNEIGVTTTWQTTVIS